MSINPFNVKNNRISSFNSAVRCSNRRYFKRVHVRSRVVVRDRRVLTECQYANDFLQQRFVSGRHCHQQAERPDRILGKRQYDDGHFGGTDVHDAHPRVNETGQRSPKLVEVGERGLIKAELATRLVDHRSQFGV